MSLSLAITVIVLADLSLIGLLAFVMSRAVRLTPHRGEAHRTAAPTPAPRPSQARPTARPAGATASSRS